MTELMSRKERPVGDKHETLGLIGQASGSLGLAARVYASYGVPDGHKGELLKLLSQKLTAWKPGRLGVVQLVLEIGESRYLADCDVTALDSNGVVTHVSEVRVFVSGS